MSETGWRIEVVPPEKSGRRSGFLFGRDAGRRIRLLLAVVAVLSVAGAVDGLTGRSGEARTATAAGASAAESTGTFVPPSDSESSAWFCAGGSGAGGSSVGTLLLTNSASRAVTGTLTASPSGGSPRSVPLSVPAGGQVGVVPSQLASGPWVAATVVLDGGGVGVSEVVDGPLGWSSAPCASSTSSNWYFAHGSTASGASLSLLLYNPTTTDAVADVTLVSASAGVVQPPAYQGIGVPAGSLVVENVGDHLTNDPSVATDVSTSSGTVVAAEVQATPATSASTTGTGSGTFSGTSGGGGPSLGGGVSLLLGVPMPSTHWDFPENVDPQSGTVVFHVYNPSRRVAVVTVDVGLAQGEAEPLSLRVPAQSSSNLVAGQETRIPSASSYSLLFSSAHGVGIVVDREVSSPPGLPAPQVGLVHGVPSAERIALLPGLLSPGANGALLSVSNTSRVPVTVTIESAVNRAPLAGLSRRAIQPGRTMTVGSSPGAIIGVEPMLVVASGPVAVELDAAPVGAVGAVVVPVLILG